MSGFKADRLKIYKNTLERANGGKRGVQERKGTLKYMCILAPSDRTVVCSNAFLLDKRMKISTMAILCALKNIF